MIKSRNFRRIGIFAILLYITSTFVLPSSYVSAASGSPVYDTAEAGSIIYGDCNNDGNVDALDFALLKQNVMDQGHTYNGYQDLNLDNSIDSIDYSIMKKFLLGLVATLPFVSTGAANKWVGTWATAQQLTEASNMPPSPGLSNNTLRQIFRVSIGGNQVRMKFSNEYGNAPVTMNSVHLAVSAGGGSIQAGTDKALTFGGKESVTIPTGKTVTSDTLDFSLSKLTNVAVTIYFGSVPSALTGHPGSRTTSYVEPGNNVISESMSSAVTTEHWYIISGMDVLAEESCKALVALGDSITDGRGSTTDRNDRWTNNLSNRLLADTTASKIAVLNQGIGGNAVLSGGLGPTAVSRFDRDVLGQSGVRYLIVLEGVNDIGSSFSSSVATNLINTYRDFINKAHAQNILVYGGTITPFGGSQYDSAVHEQARQTINNWIRTSGQFDAVIDFDAAVRNPNDQAKLVSAYDSGDHLHLSPAGYKRMADAIDLDLFSR